MADTVVTLNEAAFTRLIVYTGHDPALLTWAIPSLRPVTFTGPGEPPALRTASLRVRMRDCPLCRSRRDGAFLDTRLFPLKMACIEHGYWLYRDGSGYRLPPAVLPEIAAAQRRLRRLAARRGTDAAARAYETARRYLQEEWSAGVVSYWYADLYGRWYRRANAAPPEQRSSWMPSWTRHPECTALAVMFASPYWAQLAVPSPDRRHRRFYLHMLAQLGLDNDADEIRSIHNFDPLPGAIREQATWGRLLSDPDWDTPIVSRERPLKIPFIDITDGPEDVYLMRLSA